MTVNTAAQSRVYIGTTGQANDVSDYEADSYTEVGEVEDLGEFGDTAEEVTFTALADRRTRKFKGSFNAGTMTIVCGSDPEDVGQDALLAAFTSDFDYNFKVTLNDQITVGGTPSTLFFSGKVMSKSRNVGQVNNVVRQTFMVGINTEILEVTAT
jgi:triacylglycerol esterase/lipase EstA (alpha/beta hydrolase family)